MTAPTSECREAFEKWFRDRYPKNQDWNLRTKQETGEYVTLFAKVSFQAYQAGLNQRAAGAEGVAYLHTVKDAKARPDDTDLALSFDKNSFPFSELGWVSVKCEPLYLAPPDAVVGEVKALVKDWRTRELDIRMGDRPNLDIQEILLECADELEAALKESKHG